MTGQHRKPIPPLRHRIILWATRLWQNRPRKTR